MEWKKTWQVGGGTAEFSVSIDPNRHRTKEEEKFEDWEVVDTPPFEEMKRFHGTAPPPKKQTSEPEDSSSNPVSTSSSIAERRGHEIPLSSRVTAAQTQHDGGRELRPCDRCNGYHYIDSCAYRMSEDKWLEYRDTHMSSHPLKSIQPGGPLVKKHQTRMSDSSKDMLAEDTDHRRKRMLESGRAPPPDPAVLKQKNETASKVEGSEDEMESTLPEYRKRRERPG